MKKGRGSGDICYLVKYLLYQHGDPTSDLQHPLKKPGMAVPICNLGTGEWEWEEADTASMFTEEPDQLLYFLSLLPSL